MNKSSSPLVLLRFLLLAPIVVGCTYQSFRLTGTPGAVFHGSYADRGDEPGHPNPWSGKLPDWMADIEPYPNWRALEVAQCEFRKDDTNAVLRLELREHRYRVVVVSPPGTSGVRLTWTDNGYTSEILP